MLLPYLSNWEKFANIAPAAKDLNTGDNEDMKKLLFLMIVAALGIAAHAQTGSRVTDTAGFDFIPPSGWKSSSSADGHAFVDQAQNHIVIIKAHNYSNFQAFAAEANLAGDGLTLVGEPKVSGRTTHFRAAKQNGAVTMVVDTFVLFSPHGGGVTAVSLTDQDHAEQGYRYASEAAASVRFFKPAAASSLWKDALSGKQLIYLYTGSGYSERQDILLCASGTFHQTTDMGGFNPNNANDSSFGARGVKSGVWRVNGSQLVLTFSGGSTSSFNISKRQASNEIGLNGKRYFLKSQTMCR